MIQIELHNKVLKKNAFLEVQILNFVPKKLKKIKKPSSIFELYSRKNSKSSEIYFKVSKLVQQT